MLSVRYRPEAITPELLALIRPRVGYDADGRGSVWLVEDGAPLPAEFAAVARAVCPEDGAASYAVILQSYRDGTAVTSCHTDLGRPGFILSVGATRTFRLHRVPPGASGCGDYDLDAILIECVHGTAVVMDAAFHATWHHQIVADAGVADERLSLVFRK